MGFPRNAIAGRGFVSWERVFKRGSNPPRLVELSGNVEKPARPCPAPRRPRQPGIGTPQIVGLEHSGQNPLPSRKRVGTQHPDRARMR